MDRELTALLLLRRRSLQLQYTDKRHMVSRDIREPTVRQHRLARDRGVIILRSSHLGDHLHRQDTEMCEWRAVSNEKGRRHHGYFTGE